ncbi:type II secretion system protein GspC [Haliangium sp.]|uniref:type II secretion system protein GspC n=1 Tax=Haliangium sp. TaxID=2663208 RepID=UPI003D0CC985
MQDLIKKYFWLIGVLVVLASAALAGKGASHLLDGALLGDSAELSEPPPRTAQARRPAQPAVRSKAGKGAAERNMFCSDCEPEEAPPVDTEATDDPDAVPKTSLPLELLATNLARRPDQSFATIRNISTESQGAYWAEQEIPGAGPVVRIAGTYVDFRNQSSNRLERISLLETAKVTRNPPPTGHPPPPRRDQPRDELSSMIDEGIKKVSDDAYDVDRTLVDKLLANPMSVARGARIVPSVKDGQANGFKLYAIRPSSVYAKLGLRNGDTISSVNGFDLSSPDKALEVYTKVREASNLSVSVIRRGKPMQLNYNIR